MRIVLFSFLNTSLHRCILWFGSTGQIRCVTTIGVLHFIHLNTIRLVYLLISSYGNTKLIKNEKCVMIKSDFGFNYKRRRVF